MIATDDRVRAGAEVPDTAVIDRAIEYTRERQFAIMMFYRNYCWVPRQKRPSDGSS